MARIRRSILWAVMGLSLTAFGCGDSSDGDSDNGTGGEGTSDGGSNGAANAGSNASNTGGGQTGGANESATNTGGATAGSGECTPPGQQCMCANGQMGFQACMNGMLGDCTCGIDLSDAGLPPVAACPTSATCQSTMGFIAGVPGFCAPSTDGGGMGGGIPGLALPPQCTTKAECEAAGLPDTPCSSIMLPIGGAQTLCLQPCNP